MKPLVTLALIALLAGCGGRVALKPKDGGRMPATPETAAAAPSPDELLAPEVQARPKRSDEQLRRSEERQEDRFELPPAR
jgi:hypothetical protein